MPYGIISTIAFEQTAARCKKRCVMLGFCSFFPFLKKRTIQIRYLFHYLLNPDWTNVRTRANNPAEFLAMKNLYWYCFAPEQCMPVVGGMELTFSDSKSIDFNFPITNKTREKILPCYEAVKAGRTPIIRMQLGTMLLSTTLRHNGIIQGC